MNGVGIVATLKSGQFFGERALLTAEKRNASCIADGENCICLSLEKRHFENLLGDLKDVLEKISKTREVENHDESGVSNNTSSSHGDKETEQEKAEMMRKKEGEPVRRLPWAEDIKEFDVMRKVGSGTFGVVKLARHRKTERVVAIKCLKKVDIRKTKQIHVVLNECRSNQALNHPFVNELLGMLYISPQSSPQSNPFRKSQNIKHRYTSRLQISLPLYESASRRRTLESSLSIEILTS